MSTIRSLLPLLLFIAGALAGPLSYWETDSTTCATTCPENSKFIYEPGKTYDYQYESDLKTWVNGGTEEHSSLHMRATVQMEVLSRCEMVLKLSDVSLQDSDPQQYETRQYVERAWEFTRALQEKPLRFAFLDGQIEHICPEEEEAWVLNIKRGVLSAMQNTMPTLEDDVSTRETDVAGDCPVEYEVISEGWGARKIRKSKDILGCTERHGHQSALQGSPYRVDSDIQSLPLMKSTHECQQEINNNGLLVESTCAEEHVFRPFSSGSSGAVTEVYYKIRFNKESRGITSRQDTIRQRSTLVFDHTLTPEEVEQNNREAEKTLTLICRETRRDIRPDVPHLFSQLVRQMRAMDSRSLNTIIASANQNQPCDAAQKFIRDAVPILGTAASVAAMREQIVRGQVDDGLLDLWVTHMAFYPTITIQMLQEAKPLLQMQSPKGKVALAVSSMVHSYCRLNPGCQTDREVQEIATFFEQMLNYNCRAGSAEEHDKVLMGLKGLGNMGNAPQVLPTLLKCVQTEDVSMELKVAAIQSFRRMGCESERSELMNEFTNQAADSELRINAYMAVMQCATPSIITRVRDTLASEKINQVGSFVWTHLTNLMETSNPQKQQIREILEEEELVKVFDMDKRKFSRNVEWSGFSDSLNAGAMAEANLIFADSYVPRSASVNLTVELFGSSMNLLEIGGRLEGFESILERLFGETESNDVGRNKRDVIDNRYLERMDQTFRKDPSEPHATYSVKIFGNELRYGDFHGLNLEAMKEKLNYLDWLIELAKEHNFDQTYSAMFLDSTVTIPTAVGMPLKLSVDGTATVSLKVNGKMDIRQLFTSPASMDVTGTISPSGAVEINCEMEVNAFVARTGLRMTSTLHTSTSTDGSLRLQDGKIFNVDFNMPQDKMEVISAESKFYIVYRADEREQAMSTDRVEKQECIRGKLTKALGLEACGEISYPRSGTSTPWLLFAGPARASLVLNKKDSFSKYAFEAKYIKNKSNNAGVKEIIDNVRVSFNTPGSRIDRELTAEFVMNRFKTATLDIRTPWKRASVNGEFINTDEQKKIELSASIDGSQQYSALAEVLIEEKAATFYTPNVQITIPGRNPITLNGRVQYKEGKRLDANLNLENLFDAPVSIDGNYMIDSKLGRTDGEMNIRSSMIEAQVTGSLTNKDSSKAIRMTTEYSYNHGPQRRLAFNTKLRDQSSEDSRQYGFNAGWESSFFPRYDGDVSAEYSMDKSAMSASFNGGFDDTRRLTFSKTSTYTLEGPSRRLDSNVKFEFPYKNWEFEMDVQHVHSRNELQSTVKVTAPVAALFNMHINRKNASPLDMSADVTLHYPGREMSWVQTVVETEPQVYDHNLAIQLQKYETITVTSVYRKVPRHEITAQINVPDMEPVTVTAYLKPTMNDLQVGGELNLNREVYLANSNWEVKGNLRVFESNGDFELRYPGRHIKSEGQLTRKYTRFTGNMDLLMDATLNPNAKISVNGDFKLKMDAPDVVLQMSWPGNFVNVDVSGGFETEGWYASKKDVHGKLDFKSSFPNFEDIQGSFKHDWSQAGLDTNGELAWRPNRKVTGDLSVKKVNGWSNVETTLDINTPFNSYRVIKAVSTYNFADKSLETTNSFQWDNQEMQLSMKGEVDLKRHLLDGRISFSSPFQGFEELSMTGRHTDNGRNFNSNLEATWARGQTIGARFTMAHQRSGYSVTNNGELTITTPFPENRQVGFTWQHANTESNINCHYELQFNNRKNIYDMEATHEKSNGRRSITGKAIVNSYYTGSRSIEMSHSSELKTWRNRETAVTVNWDPRTRMSYNHKLSYAPGMLTVDAKFTSPFRGYQSIDLDLQTQKTGNTFSTKNELKWDGNNKISLTGSLTASGYDVQSNLRFTSPYQPVERVMLNMNNRDQRGIWISHGDIEYSGNQKIEIDTQFGMDKQKKLAIDFKSPFQYGVFSTDNSLRGSIRNFKLDSEVDHVLLRGKSTLSITFDTDNLEDLKTKINLRTPVPEIEYVKVIVSHKRQGPRFMSDASLEFPTYRGAVSNDMTLNGPTDFKTTSAVEYLPGKRIELASGLKKEADYQGTVTFRSPFRRFEEISMTFNHQGSLTNFNNNGEISYSPYDKLTLTTQLSLRGSSNSGLIRFTSPYLNAERVNVEFHHNGASYKAFTNGGSFEWNNLKYEAENEFNLRGSNLRATSAVKTPHPGFETVDVAVNHDGPITGFNNGATVEYGGQTVSATAELSIADDISGKLTITSPYEELRNFEASFNHNAKKWNNFQNSGNVVYNNMRYAGESRMKLVKNTVTGEAKVSIPEEYGVMLKHKGELNDFNTKAEVTVAGRPSTFTTSFKVDASGVEGNANLVTPYPGYDNFDGSFSHRGDLRAFNTEAEVNLPQKKFTTSVNFNLDTVEGSINVGTPFPNWQSTGAGFTHTGDSRRFETNANVETSFPGYQMFKGKLSHNGDISAMNSNAEIQTSIPGFERFNFNIDHDGANLRRLKSSVQLDTPVQGYERFGVNVEHRGDLRNFRTSGTLTTPFPSMRETTMNMNHRGDLRDFSSSGSLECNGKKLEGAASFKQSHPDWMNADYEGSMSMSSPWDTVRNVELTGTHSRSSPVKRGSFQVMHNGVKTGDMDYEYTMTGRRTIRLTMREPHPMETTISYELGTGTLDADVSVNWNTRERGRTVRFDTNLKNVVDAYNTDRNIAFKTTLPTRTVGISTGYTKQANRYTHNAEFQWDRQDRKKIGYEVEVSKNSRRSLDIYDGKFTLNSALLPFEMNFNHRTTSGRQYTTEVTLGTDDKLTIKNDLTLNSPSFTHTLTIQHPHFTRDAVISTEGTMQPKLLEGKVNVEYERETFAFAGKLADESNYDNLKMTGMASLKHPNSMLDFEWTGELINNNQLASGNMQTKYMMTKTRQAKIMSLRAEVKKLQQEMSVELVTPMKELTMSGRRTSEGQYTGEMTSGRKTINGDLTISPETQQVELQLRTSQYDNVQITGQYRGPRSMSIEIKRQQNGAPVKDIALSMNLLKDNIVSGSSSIRPELWEEIKEWYRTKDFYTPAAEAWEEVYRTAAEDLVYKKNYMSRSVKPISDAGAVVAESAGAKMEEIREMFEQMYINNDFHIQDAYVYMVMSWMEMVEKMNLAQERLYLATAPIRAKMDEWKICVQTRYDTLYLTYAPVLNEKYQTMRANVMMKMEEYRPYTENFRENAKAKFMDFVDRVRTHPKVQMWIERLTTMSPEEYMQSLRDLKPVQMWLRVRDWPMMKPIRMLVDNLHDKVQEVYETHLKETLEGLYAGGMQYVKSKLYNKANDKLHLDQDRWTVWDPQRGEYAFQFFVPEWPMKMLSKIPDFPDMPDIDISQYVLKARNYVMSWIPEGDWYVSDLYYRYKPSADIFNWIPPFKGRAVLAGSQHFMTFDKNFYEYTGECSYLLARDFLNGHFSVIVNYERIRDVPTKKSITVVSGDHQFEIFPSAKVVMDGSNILEMPVQQGDTTIVRTAHNIRVDNKHGVTVTCNLEHDRCTVNVTGWYFARTGGLLGTYNNEPVDDFMTPGRVIANNEAEFADSWTVGQRCRQANYATDVQTSPDNHHFKLCSKYFLADDSPFRPCFHVVEPKEFMDMCLNDMPANINSIPSEEDVCKMANFYMAECKHEGVRITMPKVCVRCDLHDDKHFIEGQNVTLEKGEAPEAADIVFVIQHHTCTQEPMEQLEEIAEKIYKAYKGYSIKDLQFSVVGFGGKGVEQQPHVHTMEGRLFNSRDKLVRVVENFGTEAGDHDDVMEAVHYAAKLPFRAGVAKSIVLITCDLKSCQEKSINYLELQNILFERDIRLHYLLEHEFVTKTGKPVGIYGVDDESVFTKKDAKRIIGNQKLRDYVSMPKNLCAVLAEETDGSIFDIQKWRDVKPTLGDKFEDAFTKLVAKKGMPTECQNCECVPDESGIGMPICRDCSYGVDDGWFGSSVYLIGADDEIVESGEFTNKPKTKALKTKKKNKKTKTD